MKKMLNNIYYEQKATNIQLQRLSNVVLIGILTCLNPDNFGGIQTMIGYDPANPALDQNKLILMPLGMSSNGAFYRFWLCQYISNPESWKTDYDYLECDSEFLNAEERETKIAEVLDALAEPLFDREVAEELYMLRSNQENAAEFEGMFMYYSHSGGVSAKAEFIKENVAIHRMYDWEMKKSEEYLLFCRTEEGMKIYATTGDSGKLGFGAGCRADGEYVQGEPVYTNGTAMNDNFTVEEQIAICNLLESSDLISRISPQQLKEYPHPQETAGSDARLERHQLDGDD